MKRKIINILIAFLTILLLVGCFTKSNNGDKPIVVVPDELVDSPTENDTRESSEYNNQRIIVDNEHKEVTFKQAGIYQMTNEKTIIGDTFISSEKGTKFEARWTPVITEAGYYKIYMNWPEFENAFNKVPITVTYEEGSNVDETKIVDQTKNAGHWVFIGTYYLAAGNKNFVSMKGVTDEYVIGDAVMFELSKAEETLQTETTLSLKNPYEAPSELNIVKTHDQVLELRLDGDPFFVKGVNGSDELELIKEAGGNAIRTYSTVALENGKMLDKAHALGLKVVVGLWMLHESSNFTYHDNPARVNQQYENLILEVEKYKNHPAIIGWAVGNEVDISTSLNPKAIYDAMNKLAKYIHESDPTRPTMAVLAGSSPIKITNIMKYAPHIDIIGLNSYRAIGNVSSNILGWKGPYMITEYALDQPMEIRLKTSWGAIIEPNSIDKADLYYNRYQNFIYNKREEGAVGGFVFKDSGSFRITHTWYGIIYNSKRTPAFEAVKAGFFQTERLPSLQIDEVLINGKSQLKSTILEPGTANIDITVTNEPPNVKYSYEVRKDVGLSVNNVPSPLSAFSFDATNPKKPIMTVPEQPGNYRLFVYIENETHISSYSYPFQVWGDPFVLEEQPNVVITSIKDTENYTETGTFTNSTNRFYDGELTRFTREKGAYATFAPTLTNPGKYEVFYYNLSEGMGQTDDNQVEITIHHAGGKTTITLGVTITPSGWESLGEFTFDLNSDAYVTVTKILDGNKVVRGTAISFLPKE